MDLVAFTKIALNLMSARKATQAVKPYLIRRGIKLKNLIGGSSAELPKETANMYVGPVTTHPSHAKAIMRSRSFLSSMQRGSIKSQQQAGIHGKSPHVFAKGDITAKGPGSAKWILSKGTSGADKEMINRTMLMHEGSEVKHLKGMTPRQLKFSQKMTHSDPKVLLEEHNMMSTLPKKHRAVRRYYRILRDMGPEQQLFRGAGLRYGSKRLSPRQKKFYREKMLKMTDKE